MSSFGLAKNLGIETKAVAAYIVKYFQRHPGEVVHGRHKAQAKAMGEVENRKHVGCTCPRST